MHVNDQLAIIHLVFAGSSMTAVAELRRLIGARAASGFAASSSGDWPVGLLRKRATPSPEEFVAVIHMQNAAPVHARKKEPARPRIFVQK